MDRNQMLREVSVLLQTAQSELEIEAKYADKSCESTIVGITSEYQQIINYTTDLGEFLSKESHEYSMRFCVLGADAAKKLFPVEDPIGKMVKLGDQWFEVVGVMGNKMLFTETVG